MLYNVKWIKKPYFNHNNLRSVDIDDSNEQISIFLQINENKGYTHKIKAYDIDKIQFCIGYGSQGVKSVFFMIYHNKGKQDNNVLAFYLPRNYDKELVSAIYKFALKYKITYLESKGLNPFLFLLFFALIAALITYLFSR